MKQIFPMDSSRSGMKQIFSEDSLDLTWVRFWGFPLQPANCWSRCSIVHVLVQSRRLEVGWNDGSREQRFG
ncbi:hypothetical protein RRG08_015977 [Elysia crispata]|uniref:Uncharacterized protein n=1 Tax=Elysia crispata TaxID=231223 RepID=A0AAE0YEC2_9GAST|nr:hypothetical protein RRG08_015977 [Elysia crispata]